MRIISQSNAPADVRISTLRPGQAFYPTRVSRSTPLILVRLALNVRLHEFKNSYYTLDPNTGVIERWTDTDDYVTPVDEVVISTK